MGDLYLCYSPTVEMSATKRFVCFVCITMSLFLVPALFQLLCIMTCIVLEWIKCRVKGGRNRRRLSPAIGMHTFITH